MAQFTPSGKGSHPIIGEIKQSSLVKGAGNDVRRYGGISNWKGLPANVSFSP